MIMLSAADDVNTMVDCILQGAEDYIFKPFNPILLQARISACLEKVRLRQNISRQFRVFISSPGDVIPERQIVISQCPSERPLLDELLPPELYVVSGPHGSDRSQIRK